MKLKKENVLPTIINALKEDVGSGDLTSALVLEKDVVIGANIIANEACVLAGIDLARWVFSVLDERIGFTGFSDDGNSVKKGRKIASVKGYAKAILAGERTVLNFLGKLSGVATLTGRFIEKVKGAKSEIFDTRKTSPGMRELEKYAVRIAGGRNHRMGLWDRILIKDNHLDVSSRMRNVSRLQAIKDIIKKAKAGGYKDIELEVDNLREFREALGLDSGIIMLDNMKIGDIRKAVRLRDAKDKKSGARILLEVSGGVGLKNVAMIAKTGVDRISIGSLTHSAPAVDFSLEICM